MAVGGGRRTDVLAVVIVIVVTVVIAIAVIVVTIVVFVFVLVRTTLVALGVVLVLVVATNAAGLNFNLVAVAHRALGRNLHPTTDHVVVFVVVVMFGVFIRVAVLLGGPLDVVLVVIAVVMNLVDLDFLRALVLHLDGVGDASGAVVTHFGGARCGRSNRNFLNRGNHVDLGTGTLWNGVEVNVLYLHTAGDHCRWADCRERRRISDDAEGVNRLVVLASVG